MKSYTNIEQSKKLAGFLPLESADTIWDLTNPDLPIIRAIPYEDSDYNNKYLIIIPAWSLAALLSILPAGKSLIHGENTHKYKLINCFVDAEWHDNPIDACVVVIEKLNELNLL